MIAEHTLLHWEALFVIATSNPENVPLKLVAQRVASHLSGHTLLVEGREFLVVLHLDLLDHAGNLWGFRSHATLLERANQENQKFA